MKEEERQKKVIEELSARWREGDKQVDRSWQEIRKKAQVSHRRDLVIRWTLLMIVALVLLTPCVWQLQKAYQSKGWPSVLGYINSSEARNVTVGHSGGVTARWRYDVDYIYLIDGVQYSGTWSDTVPTQERALEIIQTQYKQGQRVPVYYNPSNLPTSVLEPGMHIGANYSEFLLILFAVGLVLFVTSLAVIIFNISKLLKERRARGTPPSPKL